MCFPLQRRVAENKVFYWATEITSLVLLILYAAPSLATPYLDNSETCQYTDQSLNTYLNINRRFIQPSLYLFLPFIIVFTANCAVCCQLTKARQSRLSMTGGGSKTNQVQQRQQKTESMLTWMLIVSALAFIMFTLPQCIFYISGFQKDVSGPKPSVSLYRKRLFQILAHVFADSTHAINFVLYFIFNSRFRGVVLAIPRKLCGVVVQGRRRASQFVSQRSGKRGEDEAPSAASTQV